MRISKKMALPMMKKVFKFESTDLSHPTDSIPRQRRAACYGCPITCLPSAVAATRHDEADFPLAEGGPKARASQQRAMPLWFAVCLYIQTPPPPP